MGQFLIFETKKMTCHLILYIYHNSISSDWLHPLNVSQSPCPSWGAHTQTHTLTPGKKHSEPPGHSAMHAWQRRTGSERWQDLPQPLNPAGLRQPSFQDPTP